MEIRYSYKTVPTLKRFSESNAFMRACLGPLGSGKSSACVIEILKRAAAQAPGPDGIRRTRWCVIRQHYPQLRDTTIKTFMQWCPPHRFGTYKQSDNVYTIEAFENTRIEVLFRALDQVSHVSNLLSLDLTGGWINEAKDIQWAVVDALQGRVGRYPPMNTGGPTWHGIFMDTNPPDTDSKFYKFWEETEHNPQFADIFKQPSGLSANAENLDNLPANYYKNLSIGKDPEWVKVFVHGQYGYVQEGRQVFPEYRDETHCAEIKPVSYATLYRGWDFGLTPSCTFSQLSPTGQFLVHDELTSDSMGVDQFSDEVLAYTTQHYSDFEIVDIGDPAGQQRAQTDERTCFNILHAKQIMIEPGLQSLTIRLESIRRPLTRLSMGKPAFQIHPRCKQLRKAFMGGYCYRRLQTTGEKYTAVPDKNSYSHVMDSLEYVATRLFGEGLTSSPRNEQRNTDNFDQFERSEITGY